MSQALDVNAMNPYQRVLLYQQMDGRINAMEALKYQLVHLIEHDTPQGSRSLQAGWVSGIDTAMAWLEEQQREVGAFMEGLGQLIKRDQLEGQIKKKGLEIIPPAAPEPVAPAPPAGPVEYCQRQDCVEEVGGPHPAHDKTDG